MKKCNYALSSKLKPFKSILKKYYPKQAEKFNEIFELKQHATLLNDLLSTTREKSVSLEKEYKISSAERISDKMSNALSKLLSHSSSDSQSSKKRPYKIKEKNPTRSFTPLQISTHAKLLPSKDDPTLNNNLARNPKKN